MTYARYEAAFGLLYLLDYKSETEEYDATYGWMLVDAVLPAADGEAIPGTGGPLHAAYEELLSPIPPAPRGRTSCSAGVVQIRLPDSSLAGRGWHQDDREHAYLCGYDRGRLLCTSWTR